ncbi:hypothetical protein SGLAM104S_02652 [Streptomyces glaucescens]
MAGGVGRCVLRRRGMRSGRHSGEARRHRHRGGSLRHRAGAVLRGGGLPRGLALRVRTGRGRARVMRPRVVCGR